MGSALYSHIKNNKLESTGSSITEGIGTGRITKNFDKALVDEAFQTNVATCEKPNMYSAQVLHRAVQ